MMNLGRIFASTVARRVVFALVALVLAALGIDGARAQDFDQGSAYVEAMRLAAQLCTSQYGGRPVEGKLDRDTGAEIHYSYLCAKATGGGSHGRTVGIVAYVGRCSAQPAMQNVRFTGNSGSCSGGCAYAVDSDGTWESVTVGGVKVTKATKMLPTGKTCTVGDSTGASDPLGDKEECVQTDALTQCVRPDGKHCATASTGATFCWSPGEAGVKTTDNGNQAATKSPENTQINAPKDAPKNGGDWTVTGQGQVSTSSSGGGTTANNVTTFDSSYGKDGTGKGTGTGTGDGDGDGEGEGDDDGAGQAGEGVGDLYEGTDKTAASLAEQWFNQVSNTPILQGMTSFMTVSGGGSCPVISLQASQWWEAMSYTAHCSGDFLSYLRAAGWLIFAIACYFAVRIAVT